MSKYLLLKNFNSYHNRIIKKYDSIVDYGANSEDYILTDKIHNFYQNDGITSEIVFNFEPEIDWVPDYVLVLDDDSNIKFRYFVMEAIRNRRRQYSLQLRRDVVADYKEQIVKAPAFIEKATLSKENPFIFNKENMSYNQIKDENEILLKDKTGISWLVGYLATPQTKDKELESMNIEGFFSGDIYRSVSSLDELPFSAGLVSTYDLNDCSLQFDIAHKDGSSNNIYSIKCPYANLDGSGITVTDLVSNPPQYHYWKATTDNISTIKGRVRIAMFGAQPSTIKPLIREVIESDGYLDDSVFMGYLRDYNNKIIFNSSNNKYYNISIKRDVQSSNRNRAVNNTTPELYSKMETVASSAFDVNTGVKGYSINYNWVALYTIRITETVTPGQTVKTTISATRNILQDSPYCMFAIPADAGFIIKKSGSIEFENKKDFAFAAARAISEKTTGTYLYDLQLLPYCPRQDLVNDDGVLDLTKDSIQVNIDYNFITDNQGVEKSILIWCKTSEGSIDIPVNITVPTDDVDFKIEDETSFYRLSSPNYAAQFEFSATKNYGVDYVNIDFAYKPFTPYIHANINLKGIYGTDTNDTRGLICSGDFSMPQTADQWSQYELNNKNYENSFNRQIENMNVMHKWDMLESGINALVGAGVGGVAGSRAGSSFGPAGAIAGGVIGSVASLGAGIADQFINQEKFNETIDYTRDQFGFQLGNIQARADTLAKVSAFNPNNKVFLFIEHYHATPEEREALRQKIYYNGMTVGVIGKIEDFIREEDSYIKGQIIRIQTGDDAHMNSEIYNEIYKGVFIK